MHVKAIKRSRGSPIGPTFDALSALQQAERLVLPTADNSPGALRAMTRANELYRRIPWPHQYRTTTHRIIEGDARNLRGVDDSSIHLVVTSPPYWTLKRYNDHLDQLGHVADYEAFLGELLKVWRECMRVLVPGG